MLKLSKLTVAVTVYRGTGGATLPKSFFVMNEDGLRGGIEFGFTSTTPDRSVAVQYAGKAAATVISARMGMVDRGADISWLSQFAHEKASAALLRHVPPSSHPIPSATTPRKTAQEVLFPPLMALEVLSSGVENRLMVVDARLSLNMMSQTLEQARVTARVSPLCRALLCSLSAHPLIETDWACMQVIGKMQTGHVSLVSTMLGELKHFAPAKALAPLQAVLDNAKRRGLAFFNVRASALLVPLRHMRASPYLS